MGCEFWLLGCGVWVWSLRLDLGSWGFGYGDWVWNLCFVPWGLGCVLFGARCGVRGVPNTSRTWKSTRHVAPARRTPAQDSQLFRSTHKSKTVSCVYEREQTGQLSGWTPAFRCKLNSGNPCHPAVLARTARGQGAEVQNPLFSPLKRGRDPESQTICLPPGYPGKDYIR